MNHVELARAGFEAFNRGDIEAVLEMLDPDVEVHSVAEVGEEGTYHGHQGYLEWTGIWLDAWSEFTLEILDIEEIDDENVLVHSRQVGKGKGSGVEVEQFGIYLFTVRNGLATRLHLYATREDALAAARS
jgi:ketosteroid isomerase-like protein